MLLTLIKQEELNSLILPDKITGKYLMYHTNADGVREVIFAVEADGNRWKVCGGNRAAILGADYSMINECFIDDGLTIGIHIRKNGETAVLSAENVRSGDMCFRKIIMASACEFTLGTRPGSILFVQNRFSGKISLNIKYEPNTGFYITGASPDAGAYLNGKRIKLGAIKSGDVITIVNTRFVFGANFISYDRAGSVSYNSLYFFAPFILPEKMEEKKYYFDDEYDKGLFFCSPRFKKELERKQISIDYPPAQNSGSNLPAILSVGPSMTMGISAAATAGFTVTNQLSNGGSMMSAMPSVIMASSMLLSSLMWPILTKAFEKRRLRKLESLRKRKYIEYLKKQENLIDGLIGTQKQIIADNNPDPAELAKRIETRDRTLWERMYGQSDFMSIVVGRGRVPLTLEIQQPNEKFSMDDDLLRAEADKFMAKDMTLSDAPVELSLTDDPITGIIGNRGSVLQYVKSWLLQLIALYSYDGLGIIILYDPKEKYFWESCRWLPHIWNDDGNIRMIASDIDELRVVSSQVEKLIGTDPKKRTRHYVVISADRRLAIKADFIRKILSAPAESGFSLVALYDRLNYLPRECTAIVDVADDNTARFRRSDGHTSSETELSLYDVAQIDLSSLCVALSNINLARNDEAFSLPPAYIFLEMYEATKVDHLNCLERWKQSNPVESLKVPIGINSHGDISVIDMHEKYHGPHGLIAGMTGSGKSEFIMTMILSLAVNFHPDEVAFVLIDYKGGGMANAFQGLPHVAGIITNLDGSEIMRSLVSIESELKRREAMFSKAEKTLGISSLNIYKYQKLYRDGLVNEPMPHLMIISDEFAELKAQQPEFMAQLISAARIGRSLGVHLILATQKPSGVVDDQIWSNSKFKICLKVQDRSDSSEMIKRPDAAELVEVGRYYMQVGNDEYFELAQSAWCGAEYMPDSASSKKDTSYITFIDNIGRTIIQADDTVKSGKRSGSPENKQSQLDAIRQYIIDIAAEENIKTRALWLDPIPDVITVSSLKEKYGYTQPLDRFCAVMGEYDVPKRQEQKLMVLDIEDSGNIAVYGSSGTGKTTFLTTMAYSLAECYSPSEVWIYILDFNAQTTRPLGRLNHVGDVMLPDDKEKITHFFDWINNELKRRRKTLSETDGNYYNYIRSGNQMPWITVMIHNFGSFIEVYPNYDELLITLTRECVKYGISFVLTAATTNTIMYRIQQNIKTKVCLQLNDGAYVNIFERTRGMRPSPIKGRGLAMLDGLVEFQTAYISEPDAVNDSIAELSAKLHRDFRKVSAYRIPVLPDVYKPSIAAEYALQDKPGVIPIALDAVTVEPYMYDTARPLIYIVSKSCANVMLIQGIAEYLTSARAGKVMVCDVNSGFLSDENRSYEYYSDPRQFCSILSGIPTDTGDRIYIIINTMSEFINALRMPDREIFEKIMNAAHKQKNITIVTYDRLTAVSAYSSEQWYRDMLGAGTYIWTGPGLYDQWQFPKAASSSKLEVKADYGFIVDGGQESWVKLLSSEVYEHEG